MLLALILYWSLRADVGGCHVPFAANGIWGKKIIKKTRRVEVVTGWLGIGMSQSVWLHVEFHEGVHFFDSDF